MNTELIVKLAAFAAAVLFMGYGLQQLWRAGKVRLWDWLMRRHEKKCEERTAIWRGKIVRQPSTGQLGWCADVCVWQHGWRDMLCPRWTAAVAVDPSLAAVLYYPAETLAHVMGKALASCQGMQRGDMRRVLLTELSIAPQCDASEFWRKMEESRIQ